MARKVLSLLVALAVLAGCLVLLGGCGGATTVTVFYTSDMHGYIFEDEEAGTIGLARIAARHAATKNSLLLDGGDFLHGVPAATLSQGEDVVRLMKQAGYDAVAVGNHEFSYGAEVLAARQAQAAEKPDEMPFLSSNVWAADGTMRFTPYKVFHLNGLRVGVFGLTTPQTGWTAAPEAVDGLTFEDPVEAAQRSVQALQAQKCHIIIALAHIGSDASTEVSSEDVAMVPGVDLVIDAHSHVVLGTTAQSGTMVVAAGEYGQHLGMVTITYDRSLSGVASIGNALLSYEDLSEESDTKVQAALDALAESQQQKLAEVVAATPVALEAEKQQVRTVQTNLGSLTADALRNATGADFALMNGGCVRASISAGDITMGQVLEAFPYSNLVVTKAVTGSQLHQLMEHAVGLLPEADGRFMQISGFVVEVNAAAPAGERVVALTRPGGGAIDPDGSYTIATVDYIASGGDDYPILAALPELTLGATVEEVFIAYLQTADLGAYPPNAADRIVFV